MNAKLKQGYRSIQGYLDTKNPNDSWVTACYATAYWSMNRMWQLARYNLGLSNALGGTGLCLDYELLKEYGWGATCLTEDLEFTMKLLTARFMMRSRCISRKPGGSAPAGCRDTGTSPCVTWCPF